MRVIDQLLVDAAEFPPPANYKGGTGTFSLGAALPAGFPEDAEKGLQVTLAGGALTAYGVRYFRYADSVRVLFPLCVASGYTLGASSTDILHLVGCPVNNLASLTIARLRLYITVVSGATYKLGLTVNDDSGSAIAGSNQNSAALDMDAVYLVDLWVKNGAAGAYQLRIHADWNADGTPSPADPVSNLTFGPANLGVVQYTRINIGTANNNGSGTGTYYIGRLRAWNDATSISDDNPGALWIEPYGLNTLAGTGRVLVVADRDDCAVTVDYKLHASATYTHSAVGVPRANSTRAFTAALSGLTPGTWDYRVTITDADGNTKALTTTYTGTALQLVVPADTDTVRAIAGEDTQASIKGGRYVYELAARVSDTTRPSVWVHLGDRHFLDIAHNDANWRLSGDYVLDWCAVDWRERLSVTPLVWNIYAPGTHECREYAVQNDAGSYAYTANAVPYLPLNSPLPTGVYCHTARIGSWELICLDTSTYISPATIVTTGQLDWLEAQLNRSTAKHKTVVMHYYPAGQPPAGEAGYPGARIVGYADLLTLCHEQGVSLILCGHSHRGVLVTHADAAGDLVYTVHAPRAIYGDDGTFVEYTIPQAPETVGPRSYLKGIACAAGGAAIAKDARGFAKLNVLSGGIMVSLYDIDNPGAAPTLKRKASATIR